MSWLSRLRPGSFRGVPFHIEEHEEGGGRRVDVRQYPLRDTPSTEDLGQDADTFRVQAYIIADLTTGDYIDARDALRKACRQAGPGTLVHPYLGTVSVNCRHVAMRESITQGGIATFALDFVVSGLTPSPTLSQDTAASALSGLQSLLRLAVQAYAIGSLIAERPGVLLGFAESYLASVAAAFTGLPASVFTQIASTVAGIVGSLAGIGAANVYATGASGSSGLSGLVSPAAVAIPQITSSITGLTGDPVAIAISDAFTSAASAITSQPDAPASDPVLGVTLTLARMTADPTQGLLPLASWGGSTLAAPAGLQIGLQAELQTQLTNLVQGCAVIAIARIYAGTEWISSNAAAAAKEQLLDLLDAQAVNAASDDDDAIYQGWLGMIGLATADLVQRAQSLPTLTAYTTQTTLPAAVLAQLLLQDGSQADSLVALNDAVHPSFMPASGVYLQ